MERRPDRAVIVYSNRAREAYKDVPVIIGGLEASLRRLAHYDYWDDKVRRSILLDSKADILVYGMGERAVLEIAEALDSGIDIKDISWIRGTCVKLKDPQVYDEDVVLPDFSETAFSKDAYGRSFTLQYRSNDAVTGRRLLEPYGDFHVVQNPPQPPLEREELDQIYSLPYMRDYHSSYEEEGGVPAIKEIKFSITANRGCFGGCAFCAITYHQGRGSQEQEQGIHSGGSMYSDGTFRLQGYIHDVEDRLPISEILLVKSRKTMECAGVRTVSFQSHAVSWRRHSEYMEVLRALRNVDGVKKVFIRSGIRYDYLMADKKDGFLEELCRHHVSGILKVAPEHVSENVLRRMRKPSCSVFDSFSRKYREMNRRLGKKQYMVPYFISSHPGSTLEDAVELALYMKDTGFIPDQVQDFYPTPGTLATCMYYTEKDPFTGEKIYVAKSHEEKKMQRALMHFHKKENRKTVIAALKKVHREDLIFVLK